ncbi:hypothetical protein EfmJHP10_15760 [Enterococcus faecium]|nr:hypothetical protein EfmJHP10_15760 [Enterococcus faecium]
MEKSEQRNLKDWNQLLNFLAAPEEGNFEELTAPTLILAGNCLPILADNTAQTNLNGQVDQLFLVGGVGHATRILYENFEKQGFHFEDGMSESEICRQYLKEVYDFAAREESMYANIVVEDVMEKSNGLILHSLGAVPEKILLMNDPTLQRRTRATFEKVWQNEQTIFANAVPFVPEILHFSEEIIFTAKELNHQWPKEYFHALVLGEMERLHDDENGYGPKGKDFIPHIDISEEVWSSYTRIKESIKTDFSRT